jgi:hypothetical protein
MSVKTYDPKNLVVIFGLERIHGFSEDDMITVKPNGDGSTIYVGADGEVGRSIDPNGTFEVTISLAQTSASNDTLSTYRELDRATGKGLLPLAIKDLSGTTVFTASQAWVKNLPEAKKGKSIDANEWTIYTGNADAFVGGNS